MIYFPNNFGGRQFPLGAPNERDSRDDWVIFMNKSNILPLILLLHRFLLLWLLLGGVVCQSSYGTTDYGTTGGATASVGYDSTISETTDVKYFDKI